jgi:predicted permease
VDIWVPSMMQQQIQPGSNLLESRGNRSVQGLARLRPGTTLEAAQANSSAIAAQLAEEYPDSNGEQGSMLIPLKVSLFPQSARAAVSAMVWILMGVVGVVLLIACANVANLLLARAAARRREVSVRLALGAGRGRLVRQLLTESMLLAAVAGGFGVVVAIWTNRLIVSLQPPLPIPIDIDVGIDPTVLAFTAVAALLTGVLFGMAPAVRATRLDLVPALKGASPQGDGRSWLKNTLVISQISLSMVLLIGAGLFLRSLQNAQSIDPDFDASNMLVAALDPGLQGYDEAQSDEFYGQLMERVGALPGVRSVSIGLSVPLTFGGSRQWGFSVEGYDFAPNERDNVDYNVVGSGYFRTLGIPIVAGREFTDADVEDAQPAIVINETFARRFFADRDPIGGIVNTMRGERVVVGVAQDSKYYTIGEDPLPYVYGPYRQVNATQMALHVRTDSDPLAVVASVRAETRNLDASLPLFDAATMSDHVGNALLLQRLTTGVFGTFGSLALLLAAVGLYGVMAFAVAQRTREIGIRVALGADGADVRGLVLKKSMSLALIGLAIGLALGLGLAVVIAGALYDVSPFDPLALGGSTVTILAVAFVASYLPALRATRIDPIVALRN